MLHSPQRRLIALERELDEHIIIRRLCLLRQQPEHMPRLVVRPGQPLRVVRVVAEPVLAELADGPLDDVFHGGFDGEPGLYFVD